MPRGDNLTHEDRVRGGRNSHRGRMAGKKGGQSSRSTKKSS